MNRTYKEKQCVVCGKLFIPSGGKQIYCSQECSKKHGKEHNRQYNKQYYQENKERVKKWHKQYRQKNKEYIRKYDKQYYQENKERIKEYSKQYREEHREHYKELRKQWKVQNEEYSKEYHNNYTKQRKRTNPNYKMSYWCRDQIHRCLKSKKTKHTFDILLYTPDELRLHLESQFKDDMSWENHGTLWHIDHIKPLCLFNFINEDGTPNYDTIREANSLENLQPLYVEENLSKGGEYDEAC